MGKLASLAVLVLALAAIFHGVVLGDGTILNPRGLYGAYPWSEFREEMGVRSAHGWHGDALTQHLPIRIWMARELRAGRFPLWCDDALGGFPVYADHTTGALNPLRALLLVATPLAAWEIGIAVCLAIAFLGMRWFLRSRGVGEIGATLGALLFAFGPLPAIWMHQDGYLWVHALVPLVLGLAERHASSGRLRHAAFAGTAVALSLLGGALQYGAMLLLAGAVVLLFRRSGIRALGAYLAVALGLSMAAWWPALGWLASSARDTLGERVFWLPPWRLVTLASPFLVEDTVAQHGHVFVPRAAQTLGGLVPQARAYLDESTLSVGAVGFLLVLVAWRRVRGTWARLYRNAGVALVLVGMVGPLVALAAPGLGGLSFGRVVLLATFPLAALAAVGLEAAMRTPEEERELGAGRVRMLAGWLLLVAVVWALAIVAALVGPGKGGLRTQLPPARVVLEHLTGPAVLVPLAALVAGVLLLFGPRRLRARGGVLGVLLVLLAGRRASSCSRATTRPRPGPGSTRSGRRRCSRRPRPRACCRSAGTSFPETRRWPTAGARRSATSAPGRSATRRRSRASAWRDSARRTSPRRRAPRQSSSSTASSRRTAGGRPRARSIRPFAPGTSTPAGGSSSTDARRGSGSTRAGPCASTRRPRRARRSAGRSGRPG
jgi:hypothetical protein